jgi:hypothetical protein
MRLLTIVLFFILPQLQSQAQVITTVAGTGTSGYSGDGGAATFAQIKGAADVHPTPDGGFVIADFQNMRIRKVSAVGVISTMPVIYTFRSRVPFARSIWQASLQQ